MTPPLCGIAQPLSLIHDAGQAIGHANVIFGRQVTVVRPDLLQCFPGRAFGRLRREAPSQAHCLPLELLIAIVASRSNFLHRSA